MAPTERALVRNASSAKQVRVAKETTRQRTEREDNELRAILSSIAGKRVLWRVLEQCGVYGSVFHAESNIAAYRAGQQDVGHWLMKAITDVDVDAYLAMQKDAQQQKNQIAEPTPRSDDPMITQDEEDGN